MGSTIRSYTFDENGLNNVKQSPRGKNWPVVYLIHDKRNLYIGETTSAATRMNQHLKSKTKDPKKEKLEVIEIIFDPSYNKSVVLDYEQRLIKYCSVDKQFKNILNRNKGQQASHDYCNRSIYQNQFRVLWDQLKRHGLAKNSLDIIENDNIFKFSPYNALTGEQNGVSIDIMNDILDSFETDQQGVSLINGCAGTGKTVLAISTINSLINASNIDLKLLQDTDNELGEDIDEDKKKALLRIRNHILKDRNGKPFKIGIVFPMPGLRRTVSRVFKECGNGLTREMVLAPCDVVKEKYDILFVDESHRLSKRKNLTGYKSFDETSRKLGLDPKTTNQLEWILKSAKHVILFYDEYQSVKSSDITHKEYQTSLNTYGNNIKRHKLETQMRCEGGDSYVDHIRALMSSRCKGIKTFESDYSFLLFDDVNIMIENIRKKDEKYGLCKTVAGFSWDWKTKQKKKPKDDMTCYDTLIRGNKYDITIENYKYIWNLTNEDWITRKDSRYTIGCIHTTQGYDMNYVGVIFGEEIDYNPETNTLEINLENFKDKKVKQSTDPKELKRLILNTYSTILTRGIKGCYVYACNPNMKKYLQDCIAPANKVTLGE